MSFDSKINEKLEEIQRKKGIINDAEKRIKNLEIEIFLLKKKKIDYRNKVLSCSVKPVDSDVFCDICNRRSIRYALSYNDTDVCLDCCEDLKKEEKDSSMVIRSNWFRKIINTFS